MDVSKEERRERMKDRIWGYSPLLSFDINNSYTLLKKERYPVLACKLYKHISFYFYHGMKMKKQ